MLRSICYEVCFIDVTCVLEFGVVHKAVGQIYAGGDIFNYVLS